MKSETKSLSEFLAGRRKQKLATDAGSSMHSKMQKIVIDGGVEKGDKDLIDKIKSHPKLLPYFTKNARTEVPIAGKIDEKVISRRIDRMLVSHTDKSVVFIDYKTDANKNIFRGKHMKQMSEYSQLLKNVYPDYSIRGLILWLHDFTIEEIF
jgi:ATP-dependent exoDNAse (exonuclease V) beta subunit